MVSSQDIWPGFGQNVEYTLLRNLQGGLYIYQHIFKSDNIPRICWTAGQSFAIISPECIYFFPSYKERFSSCNRLSRRQLGTLLC